MTSIDIVNSQENQELSSDKSANGQEKSKQTLSYSKFKELKKNPFPKRGDVYWVYLDKNSGTELKKPRPAIVVSKNFCNKHLGRVTIVPVTSAKAGPADPVYENEARTEIPDKQGRLVHGKALADQLTTVDIKKLSSKICSLNESTMKKVQNALRNFLEIDA